MPARILLIEDNAANLELMRYLLRAFGYDPQLASDGAAGLNTARDEPFDLILCDVHMATLDGYEVARQLKADPRRQKVPLVAVTALAMVGDRDKILAAGFDGYIAKPIDPEAFVAQVEAYLRREQRTRVTHSPTPTTAAPPRQAARHAVLVVDNLPVNLDLARSILEPHGYHVTTAGGVTDALALARAQRFDLILSDVCMGGGSGYDFIRAVRADPHLRRVPFVFLTSTMMDSGDRATGLGLGADRYLFRPIEPGPLLAELEACLREARSA